MYRPKCIGLNKHEKQTLDSFDAVITSEVHPVSWEKRVCMCIGLAYCVITIEKIFNLDFSRFIQGILKIFVLQFWMNWSFFLGSAQYRLSNWEVSMIHSIQLWVGLLLNSTEIVSHFFILITFFWWTCWTVGIVGRPTIILLFFLKCLWN